MSFAEVLKQVKSLSYSVIIFDTAPTGHTLRFLQFPTVLEKALGKISQLSGRFGPMLNGILGQSGGPQMDEMMQKLESMREVIGEVSKQFKDSELTTFVCVCIAEFLSLYETERMIQELNNYQIDTHSIVVNQLLFPQKGSQCPQCNADELFSQKNLAHLSSLVDQTKTLSLVTPNLSDVVFRAWASGGTYHAANIFDRQGALDILSGTGTSTPYASSEVGDSSETRSPMGSRRPSIYSHASLPSLSSAITGASGRTSAAAAPSRRRKKNRIVNLRKPRDPPPPTPEPVVEESAVEDKWEEKPPTPQHVRDDSIDYDSRPNSIHSLHSRTGSPPFPAPPESVATEDITFPPTQPVQDEKLEHPKPQRIRTTPLPTATQEKQRIFAGDKEPRINVNGSILEQAFVHKVVKEMRRRIAAERELREGLEGTGKMWAVERELENLENAEELPAYGA